ncbi:DNA polymerase III, delta subunit [Selenomonas sp. oral taxon 892 str. F0426]|uniref:DNA polymerase III subunit delta n=1 Tax=Selenomonas sp. oral taxon 892 TaxID=1321785 RepID=UPI0003AD15AD|nr:DNA polymerase III subunit delta [Selenomonas sp. oral taxon 892]ERJ90439.1 DNA polymerase III, delta subunit [Selenomonas sp. oral taxon 892 str. F0426]
MNYPEFMASLAKGALPHVFLLAGEESYYTRRAEEAILRRLLPTPEERADALIRYEEMPPIDVLMESLETAPFFTDKIVVLVRDAAIFRAGKKKDEEDLSSSKDTHADCLITLLSDLPSTTYAVFTLGAKPDKRRKLYQAVEKYGRVLESEPVRTWTVENWLNGRLREMGRSMQREARSFFLNVVSMMPTISLEFLDRQLEKLTLYTDNAQFTEADLRAAFSEMPEVSVFALMDAVSARDVQRALDLLARCRADGVHFTVLLALLTRHVRQLWQAKRLLMTGTPPKGLGKVMGLHPFIAEKLGGHARGFSEATLARAILSLADADYLLKTGQAGDELLEDALIRLCRK